MICTMVWPSQNRQKTLLYIMFLSNACSTKNTFRKFVDKADRFVTHLDRFIIGTPSERTPQGLCQSDATHKPGNQGAACTKETSTTGVHVHRTCQTNCNNIYSPLETMHQRYPFIPTSSFPFVTLL